MNIDVAFGQYFEGNSVIHRLDPRFKLVITILFIVVIFLAENVFSFLLLTAALIGLILLTRIPFKVILRGMKSLLFIILFTALVNVFWYKGETLLVDFHFIHIYLEGIFNAASHSSARCDPAVLDKRASYLHDHTSRDSRTVLSSCSRRSHTSMCRFMNFQ